MGEVIEENFPRNLKTHTTGINDSQYFKRFENLPPQQLCELFGNPKNEY